MRRRGFLYRVRVGDNECDRAGYVLHASYTRYFVTAFDALRREVFGSYEKQLATGFDPVLAEMHVVYLARAEVDDELELEVRVVHLDRSSMTTEIVAGNAAGAGVTARLYHVVISVADGGPGEIPDYARTSLSRYLVERVTQASGGDRRSPR